MSAMEPPFDGLGDVELDAANTDTGGLFRGSAWLSISTVVTALGGLLFWIIAARVYSTRDVGRATALFSAILFINYATNLGLGIAVSRYARDPSDASITTYRYAIALASLTSVIGCAVFLGFAPDRTVAPLYDISTPSGIALWLAIGAGMSVTTLVDVRLLALRLWPWVFARAAAVAVIRVLLIAVEPSVADAAYWTFLVAAGVPALSGAISVVVLRQAQRRRPPWLPVPPETRAALRYALANYAPVLAEQAPLLGLPLVVLLSVGAFANANFYVAWGATLFVLMVPTAIAQILLVEGGRDGAAINHQTKLALSWSLVFMTVAWVVAWVGRDLVTVVYGESYAYAAMILPQFVAAGISWSIMSVAVTRARIEHDTRSALVITVLFAVTVLVPAAFWTGTSGVNGAVDAWLLGCVVGGCAGALFLGSRRLHAPG